MHSNVTGNKRIKKIKTGKLVDGNVAGVEKTINETDQISLAYTGGCQDGKPEKSTQLHSIGGDPLSIFPGDESFFVSFKKRIKNQTTQLSTTHEKLHAVETTKRKNVTQRERKGANQRVRTLTVEYEHVPPFSYDSSVSSKGKRGGPRKSKTRNQLARFKNLSCY